jgi:tetratricopeptide (TPR) repeat protein
MDEILDAAAKRLGSGEFDQQPGVKAELERALADSYYSEGLEELADQHYKKWIELTRGLSRGDKIAALTASAAEAGHLFATGKLSESEAAFRNVIPALRSEYRLGHVRADLLVTNLNQFAYLRRTQGDSHEAEALFAEVLAIGDHLSDEMRYVVPITRSTLASTLGDDGHFHAALDTARQAVEDAQRLGLGNTPAYGFCLTIHAGFLADDGKLVEAGDVLKQAEVIFHQTLEPSHLWLGDNLRNQAIVSYGKGQFQDAIAEADEALAIYNKSFGTHYDQYPTTLIVKGLSMARSGALAQGEAVLREALQMRTQSLPATHFWVAQAQGALGQCLAWESRFAESKPLLEAGYQTLKLKFGDNDPRTIEAAKRLSSLSGPPNDHQ